MRINPATLDPQSSLARRVRQALAKVEAANREPTDSAVTVPAATPANCAATAASGTVGSTGRPEFWASETDLHKAIVAMMAVEALPGVVAFHPANGGKRGKAEAGRLKGMGVVPGIPDLVVVVAGRCHGLEIKTDKGRLSAAQKTMAARFQCAGCEYEIARSVAGARAILRRWGAL
jgi:hypothetical protein